MSSHHVVRDEQEPALIIANGEACSLELLGQLLEWSPTVMVLDGALERVMPLGIKMDIVLGDFDRCNPSALLGEQSNTKIVHTPDQNFTDLEKGISYFIEAGYKAVNIVWATGLRLDHTLGNLSAVAAFHEKINIVLWDNYGKTYPLRRSFEKWYPAGTNLSLMPMGICRGITTSGLKYNMTNAVLELGKAVSSSNEALSDGLVKVTFEEGVLFMMECHD